MYLQSAHRMNLIHTFLENQLLTNKNFENKNKYLYQVYIHEAKRVHKKKFQIKSKKKIHFQLILLVSG